MVERASRRAATPQRFVALLRAINVGGHVVKMQALREHFEALGFSSVATVIASGNVIFDAPASDAEKLERAIEQHLRRALGYDVATFLRTPAEMEAAAAHDAFPGSGAGQAGYPLYVSFTRVSVLPAATGVLLGHRTDVDDFHVNGREIYWACRTSSSQSAFTGARLEKIIGMPATARNITTVRKLAALAAG